MLYKPKKTSGFLGETKPATEAYIDVREERRQVSTTKSPTRLTYAGSILIITYLFLCSSCSLRPVYSNNYSPQELNQLSAIEIEPIDSIEAAEFCYYLSNILPKSTTTKYLLKVKFTNKRLPLILQKNSDMLREAVSQTIQYSLVDIITNQQVTSGTFRHVTSYSTASSPYHSYIDNEKALEDLTKQGADEILGRLILYFKQNSIKDEVLPITNYSAT